MVTMTHCGITVTVPLSDVDFYKSAGYVIVEAVKTVASEIAPVEVGQVVNEKPVTRSGKK